MGSGTEAAKEAGKIVILDDNFKSIKDAIWYGRTIYHNILKFCKFQLVINVAAVVVSAIAPFFWRGGAFKSYPSVVCESGDGRLRRDHAGQ